MTNLNGFIKKTLSFFSFVILISTITLSLFVSTTVQSSAANFQNSASIKYEILQNGFLKGTISYEISSDSPQTDYVKYFTLNLPYSRLTSFTVTRNGGILTASEHLNNGGTDLVLDFDNAAINTANPIAFQIDFLIEDYISIDSGTTKRLELPIKITDTKVSTANLTYPLILGKPAWSSESISDFRAEQGSYVLTFEDIKTDVATLLFASKITYEFKINKSISNEDKETRSYQLSVPRPQYNQSVIFNSVKPSPESAYQDPDGNIFLSYELQNGESIDISIDGYVVFDKSNSYENLNFLQKADLTKKTTYWDLDNDLELKRFDQYLKSKGIVFDAIPGDIQKIEDSTIRANFYKAAYEYTLERLTPAEDTSEQKSYLRSGTSSIVENRDRAIPEDYVDFLIAIYRAYQAPARMVKGYVMPIEDVESNGFFHSWLEYWDETTGWRIVDPSLDDIKQKNLFNVDHSADHIAIISRETDPIRPNLNVYNENEYLFALVGKTTDSYLSFDLSAEFEDVDFIDQYANGVLYIENTGNSLITEINIKDPNIEKALEANTKYIILPGQKVEIPVLYRFHSANLDRSKVENTITLDVEVHNYEKKMTDLQKQSTIKVKRYWWWNPLIWSIGSLLTVIFLFAIINIIKFIYTKLKLKRNE